MKKIQIFLLLLFLSPLLTLGQKQPGKVQGTLADSTTSKPLPDATVSLIQAADSSLISFTLSSSSGFFEIRNIAAGRYWLMVSYEGFQTLRLPLDINSETPVQDLGVLKMGPWYKELEAVTVMEAPVKIKGDTIAFNANAYKTKPDAVVEDLLKKLPGVTVDRDGSIKAQGEQVQKVFVDGKPFFGDDPKIATRNLSADMVAEVEIYDDRSEQSKFNNIDDGSRTRAINLKLKKDRKRGLFGKAGAGYGTEARYSGNVQSNFFKGAMQLSLFGNANNGNRLNFTPTTQPGHAPVIMGSAPMGMMPMGGSGRVPGPASGAGAANTGIISSKAGGINYNDSWSPQLDFSGSYSGSQMSAENVRNSFRQTFLKDSTLNRSQDQLSHTGSLAHRANARLTYSINDQNSVVYTSQVSFQKSRIARNDSTASFVNKPGEGYRINQGQTLFSNIGHVNSVGNNLIWRKKFSKLGRTFSFYLNSLVNSTEGLGTNQSLVSDYNRSGVKIRDTEFDQEVEREAGGANLRMGLSYTEPIARDKIWELHYAYSRNSSNSVNEIADYNPVTRAYDLFNPHLSNHFENFNRAHLAGTNLRVVKKKYNFQMGGSMQQTQLQSNDLSKDTRIRQTFTNLLTNASFNYNFMSSKNFSFNYRGRTNQPSLTQLQPLRNISNAPYYYEGNPDLKQEMINSFSMNYRSFNGMKMTSLFATLSLTLIDDRIVNHVSFPGFGSQLTRPENADGAYFLNSNINYGIPIPGMKGSNFTTTTTVQFSRDISLVEGLKNFSRNLELGEELRLHYNYRERLDLSLLAGLTYTTATNSIQPERNLKYFTQFYSLDAYWTLPSGFSLASDLDFIGNSGRADGYNQNYTMWNASLGRHILNKKVEFRLSSFDLLNKNKSLLRNVSDNYVEDVRSLVLQRYFLLSFTYNISRMGGKNISKGTVTRKGNDH